MKLNSATLLVATPQFHKTKKQPQQMCPRQMRPLQWIRFAWNTTPAEWWAALTYPVRKYLCNARWDNYVSAGFFCGMAGLASWLFLRRSHTVATSPAYAAPVAQKTHPRVAPWRYYMKWKDGSVRQWMHKPGPTN